MSRFSKIREKIGGEAHFDLPMHDECLPLEDLIWTPESRVKILPISSDFILNQIWSSSTIMTVSSVTQKVSFCTVPDKKRLYLQSYQVQNLFNTRSAHISLRADSRTIDRTLSQGPILLARSFVHGILIAYAGEEVYIEVTPESMTATSWSILFVGYLMDIPQKG